MPNLDKFQGCIYGLAIGDALGFPVEFIDRNMIRNVYGSDGVTDFVANHRFKPGTYSDDTQQSLCISRSLIKNAYSYINILMEEISREFVNWSESSDNNRAPGGTSMGACRNLSKGTHWTRSGIYSDSCGSSMRVAPIGLVYHSDEKKLLEVARNSSIITHTNPTAVASSVGAALAVAYACRGDDPNKMLEYVIDKTKDIDRTFADKIMQVQDVLSMNPDKAFDVLGEGWVGHEAVAGALYSFLRSPNDYRQTILTAANTTGDSDSFACIAGGISGAYNGIQEIPQKWIRDVENTEYLDKIARDIFEVSTKPKNNKKL